MYGSKRQNIETGSVRLLDMSPATDLAVLLFAPDLKVTVPSADAWQQEQLQQQLMQLSGESGGAIAGQKQQQGEEEGSKRGHIEELGRKEKTKQQQQQEQQGQGQGEEAVGARGQGVVEEVGTMEILQQQQQQEGQGIEAVAARGEDGHAFEFVATNYQQHQHQQEPQQQQQEQGEGEGQLVPRPNQAPLKVEENPDSSQESCKGPAATSQAFEEGSLTDAAIPRESLKSQIPKAEVTLMEGFTRFGFSQGEQLDAVLQLRQHLQTLLEIQLAGGGLQAREFSLKLGELLGELFKAEKSEQGCNVDETVLRIKAVVDERRKMEQQEVVAKLEEELVYWEERARQGKERRMLTRAGSAYDRSRSS